MVFGSSVVTILLVTAIAVYGFIVSLGGQPVFGAKVPHKLPGLAGNVLASLGEALDTSPRTSTKKMLASRQQVPSDVSWRYAASVLEFCLAGRGLRNP